MPIKERTLFLFEELCPVEQFDSFIQHYTTHNYNLLELLISNNMYR